MDKYQFVASNNQIMVYKIKSCRDFASENTMAVGISKLSDMKLADFKGTPTNCLIVSSQEYVTLNKKTEKTGFFYR